MIAIALVYALIIKAPDMEDDDLEEEDDDNRLKPNEEYVHENVSDADMAAGARPLKPKVAPEPPDEEYIRAARAQR